MKHPDHETNLIILELFPGALIIPEAIIIDR